MTRKVLIVLGLARSGTTTVFNTVRQDKRFVSYDDPFGWILRELHHRNVQYSGLLAEYVKLVERDPRTFWEKYAPIYNIDAIQDGLSDRQRSYFRYIV